MVDRLLEEEDTNKLCSLLRIIHVFGFLFIY